MNDPRGSLAKLVTIEGGHVRPFEGFIFLCGGDVNAASARPVSVRDAIYRELAKNSALEPRVRLAEDYKDWSFDGHYKDLLAFEDHIAQLSALIVLILESPGSLAELGLFSASDSFRSKLIVFVSAYHYDQSSFIRLGPIKYLEDTTNNNAEIFPWIKTEYGRQSLDVDSLEKFQAELLDSVEERLSQSVSDSAFDRTLWLHRALLICELIWLMSALALGEIKVYLEDFGIDVSQGELKQALFLLEKIGLISITPRSGQRFYVSKLNKSFIKWKLIDGIFDVSRFQIAVTQYYDSQDKKRFRALQQSREA